MAGAIDPTFGTRLVDAVVAVGLSSALATALYLAGNAVDSTKRFAVAGGVAYALLCVGAYALPRILRNAFVSGAFAPEYLAWALAFVIPLVLVQGTVLTYLLADRGTVGVVGALVLATAYTVWVLFALGGESDVLVAYPSAVLPIVIALVLLSFVVDIAVQAAVDAAR